MLVPALTLAASFFYVGDDGSIGIGTSSPLHKIDVVGAIYSRLVTLSSSSTIAVNWNSGNVQTVTLGTSPTLTFSNGQAGGEYKLIVKQDSTGGRTITWPSTIKWENATAPTLSTGANKTDVISFIYDGSAYLGSYGLNYASTTALEYLVVAGGGGGGTGGPDGNNGGGGGGGGGVLAGSLSAGAQSFTVTVGTGGATDTNGSNSVFGSITATGGGKGGRNQSNSVNSSYYGGNGGSGGGGSYLANLGGTGTSGQGYDGATGNGGNSGGGGGASENGISPVSADPEGGDGVSSSISGSSTYYGGGGGGSKEVAHTISGGQGGGGYGQQSNSSSAGGNATANTGGGGGGANGLSAAGGAGGSGIVIIRYLTGTASATGGTITTSGGYTIHTFTSSGTFTIN